MKTKNEVFWDTIEDRVPKNCTPFEAGMWRGAFFNGWHAAMKYNKENQIKSEIKPITRESRGLPPNSPERELCPKCGRVWEVEKTGIMAHGRGCFGCFPSRGKNKGDRN